MRERGEERGREGERERERERERDTTAEIELEMPWMDIAAIRFPGFCNDSIATIRRSNDFDPQDFCSTHQIQSVSQS